jgi:hypothetical protein
MKHEDPLGYHPAGLQIFLAFSVFFLKAQRFIKLNENSETSRKNLKTICGSSPIFALSNYATFGRTQSGVKSL